MPELQEPTEDPCPCNVTPNSGKFGAIGLGLSSNVFQNPNAAAILGAKSSFAQNQEKISGFLALGGLVPPQITNLLSSLQAANTMVNNFETTSNRLSNLGTELGKPDIMSLVSTVGLAAKIQCAFGIPGLNIEGAIGAVTGPGKASMAGILAASLDIGTLMDSISVDPNNPIIPSDILQSIQFASDAIGAATTIGEGVLDLGESVYAEAAALVSMFSSLSMSFDILNDPCNKLSVSLGQNIFSPEFVTTVEESNPFVRGGFPN